MKATLHLSESDLRQAVHEYVVKNGWNPTTAANTLHATNAIQFEYHAGWSDQRDGTSEPAKVTAKVTVANLVPNTSKLEG